MKTETGGHKGMKAVIQEPSTVSTNKASLPQGDNQRRAAGVSVNPSSNRSYFLGELCKDFVQRKFPEFFEKFVRKMERKYPYKYRGRFKPGPKSR